MILLKFKSRMKNNNKTIMNEPIHVGTLNPCCNADPPPAIITTVNPNKKKTIK